jgi:uncharacterized protein (TIGR03086 family)
METIYELHRRALAHCSTVVARVRASDLSRTTPCAPWDLSALLAHLTGQNEGFATALSLAADADAGRDGEAEVAAFAPVPWSPEAFERSVARVGAAMAGAEPDAVVVLPEIAPGRPIPVPIVAGIHFVDTIVHTWDVAQALGRTWRPPEPDLVAAAHEQARQVPDDEYRTRPGAAFAPGLTGDGDDWEQTLRRLGRDPGWRP